VSTSFGTSSSLSGGSFTAGRCTECLIHDSWCRGRRRVCSLSTDFTSAFLLSRCHVQSTMTPPATLEALPVALLESICAIVEGIHRPSLYALSLVCKPCRCVASPLLFRSLHLDVRHTQQLCDDVEALSRGLQVFDSFGYVRNLHLTGELHLSDLDNAGSIEGPSQYLQQGEETSQAWALVARFLERLSTLEDLFFKSSAPLPPVLLAALHGNCRLHLHDFCPHGFLLGSLNDTSEPTRLDPYALQLLKSANLYHIGFCHHKVTCTANERMARDEADYIIEAVLEFTLHYSPNLKGIVCLWRAIPDARFPPGPEMIHRSPWSGLLSEYAGSQTSVREKRNLTSLTVGGRSGIMDPNGRRGLGGLVHNGDRGGVDRYVIDAWNERVDLATLRTLNLVNHITRGARGQLLAKAKARHFVSLSVLHIHASLELDVFLHFLPPLVELELTGEFGVDTPPAVLNRHGPTLRRLSLLGLGRVFPPYIHESTSSMRCSETIGESRLYLPVLEELAISIQRTQGDSDELAIYHELGSHPNLHKIHLVLECSIDVRGQATSEDDFDQQLFEWPERDQIETRNGHIFQSLKNCAIDKPLVAAIFSTVAAAKPPTSKPLECLTIQVSNAGKFVDNRRFRQKVTLHPPSLPIDEHMYLWEPIFDHFTRKWIAVPNHNIDSQDRVIVQEDMKAFASQHEEERDWYDQDGKDPVLGSVEPHFRTLWPDKSTGDPKKEWHSFPLGG